MAAVIGALRVNLGLNSAEFEDGMNKAKGALSGLSKAFATLGGAAILAGFTAGIGQAVGRIEETRKLTAQLDRALQNTGNAARTSGQEVSDFADKLERSTGRAAEEVLAVSTNLATFGFSRDVFFDAIELADDMSAAWGGDLKQNVEGLARALADPEKGLAMLTKRGITFTDEQKKMIAGFMKANNIIGAQGVVLDALNEQVKGVASSGFSGLTKAQANATLAIETFFETIANALGVNSGLEMSLTAVAAALDFVSANFDVFARAAGVAGAAIAVALGPTVCAAISSGAVAMSGVVVNAIRAIGIAIAANPIGLIIAALAAAVTAAFLFRDEIKQAIGIDVVGIFQAGANLIIGAMVGAFDAVKAAWATFPDFMSGIGSRAWNAFLSGFEGSVVSWTNPFSGEKVDLVKLDLSAFKAPETDSQSSAIGSVMDAFSDAQGIDYVGKLGEMLGIVGDEASTAAGAITQLGVGLDGGGGGGGAASAAKAASDALKKLANEGVAVWEKTRTPAENYALEIERLNMLLQKGAIDQDTYNRAVLQAQDAFNKVGQIGNQVTSTLQSGLADLFKGLVTGSGNAMDAVSNLLGKLGDLFLNQAFNTLFSGFGGGSGGLGGIFGGIGKLFGFARGGTIMPGGAGGIDSQLVAFRKSPNERVDITKPGQALTTGESSSRRMHITTGVAVDGDGSIRSYVKSVVQDGIEVFNEGLPDRVQQINADPRAR